MCFAEKQRSLFRKRQPLIIASSNYSGSDERCGDSCGWVGLPDGKSAVALSDGMGKGEIAARESGRTINAVLPLLKAGMDPEMALHVLNLLWSMSNRKELFPTMDLALLDAKSRELKIHKIGAAPTVIVRAPRCRPGQNVAAGAGQKTAAGAGRKTAAGAGQKITASSGQKIKTEIRPQPAMPGRTEACRNKPDGQASANLIPPERIEILTAPAMPMGVSEYSEIPCISTLVMRGDLIIMMTDGVADSMRSDPEHSDNGEFVHTDNYPELAWLRRLLSRIKSRNLHTIADLIIREAALNYGDREKDDMTVVLMRV